MLSDDSEHVTIEPSIPHKDRVTDTLEATDISSIHTLSGLAKEPHDNGPLSASKDSVSIEDLYSEVVTSSAMEELKLSIDSESGRIVDHPLSAVGRSDGKNEDHSCTPPTTVVSIPTDEGLHAECDSSVVEHDTSDKLEDLVSSCMTMMSVRSVTADNDGIDPVNQITFNEIDIVANDNADSCCTVVDTPSQLLTDEAHGCTLSKVDDVGYVTQLIDVNSDLHKSGVSVDVSSTATVTCDILVLLNIDDHPSQQDIICTDECVSVMNPSTQDCCYSSTQWAAAHNLLVPLQVQTSTSDEVFAESLSREDNEDHRSPPINPATSMGDLINFSQTCDKDSVSQELSENDFRETLEGDTTAVSEIGYQLTSNVEVSSQMSPDTYNSEIFMVVECEQVDDVELQHGTTDVAVNSRPVSALVNYEDEKTCL